MRRDLSYHTISFLILSISLFLPISGHSESYYTSSGGDRKLDFHRSLSQQDSIAPPYNYEVPYRNPPQIGPEEIFLTPPHFAPSSQSPRFSPQAVTPISTEAALGTHPSHIVTVPLGEYLQYLATQPECNTVGDCAKRISEDIAKFYSLALGMQYEKPVQCEGFENDTEDCWTILNTVEKVTVKSINGKIMLIGMVESEGAKAVLVEIAASFVGQNSILNLLDAPPDVPSETKLIELDIIVAEINWSHVVDIGNNELFNSINIEADATENSLSWSQSFDSSTMGDSTSSTFDGEEAIRFSAHARLNALLQADCAKVLGKPHITVLSGKEAIVQLGGTFATPLITEDFAEYKYETYGTILVIKPEYKDGIVSGRITIFQNEKPVAEEVDSRTGTTVFDYEGSQSSSHIRIPINQTLVMSGLTQTRNRSLTSKTPFLHRIPGVNLLFKRNLDETEHTELVVLVTPQIPTIGNQKREAFSTEYDPWFAFESLNLSDQNAAVFLGGCDRQAPCNGCDSPFCSYCCPRNSLPKVQRTMIPSQPSRSGGGHREYDVPRLINPEWGGYGYLYDPEQEINGFAPQEVDTDYWGIEGQNLSITEPLPISSIEIGKMRR